MKFFLKRIIILGGLAILIFLLGTWAIDYFALFKPEPSSKVLIPGKVGGQMIKEVKYTIVPVAEGLHVPWSIVFTDAQRMLVTERNGNIRIIEQEKLKQESLAVFPEISTRAEEWLMGMALDPEYQQNKYVYVCLAYPKGDNLVDKVIRFRDEGSSISEITTIFDEIPAARFHAGCRLRFGPDGKLYITTGDATKKELAQQLDSLAGKILRINRDGSIPIDNPFPNSPVWSFGQRNPQGIDWQPHTNLLFSTEHGPSLFDGAAGGDEVNLIEKGGNYGWPIVSHEKSEPGLISPLLVFTPAIAPASGMFYRSDYFPQFQNNFLFGLLKGEGIMRVVFSEENPEKVIMYEKLEGIEVGRIREVAEGPNGEIYFSTSNQDGRGETRPGDDKIYKIIPSRIPK